MLVTSVGYNGDRAECQKFGGDLAVYERCACGRAKT